MNAKDNRTPKKGDHVFASGQEGEYVVYNVDPDCEAADLQQIGSDLRLSTIPWFSLTFLDEG
jgi:hypothetical protein